MKGLIRNNFYTVEGSMKATLLVSLAAAIILSIAGRFAGDGGDFISFIIAGNLGGYGALTVTVMQKDAASKWNKFELTMPVSRKDVVIARYLSCFLYILIGVIVSISSLFLFYLVTGSVNLERAGFGFAFGIGFAFAIPTFVIPLVMILGTDKTEPIMFVAVIMGLILFFASSAMTTPFLKDFSNADLIFRLGYVVFSFVLFAVSYMISRQIYKSKEL